MTLEELKEKIVQNYDEVSLIEKLGISMELLVECLSDYIEENYDDFNEEFEDKETDS
jgi:hypothetical protein